MSTDAALPLPGKVAVVTGLDNGHREQKTTNQDDGQHADGYGYDGDRTRGFRLEIWLVLVHATLIRSQHRTGAHRVIGL